ncbi:hypothetical protein FJT64_018882 [Amphibalanus amphitrite]|uniref:Uncharacterized protein n=1 Tax=Amphibalanus amphitrite TaxID=1232801 RepID=A0A6A4X6W1_AMPAM|nr:hypothetical protein FJT64_018882 [Amphibalanus amphitrite]
MDACHRIGRQTAGKPRTIIVKFARFDQRQELFAARRQLREVAAPAGGRFTAKQLEKIFVSDNLTQHRQSILYAARQLRRKGKLFVEWSDVGQLKVRVTRGGDTKHITSFDDLRNLAGSDPDLPCAESVARPAAAAADAVASVPAAPTERPPVTRGKGKRGARSLTGFSWSVRLWHRHRTATAAADGSGSATAGWPPDGTNTGTETAAGAKSASLKTSLLKGDTPDVANPFRMFFLVKLQS